MSRRLRRWPVVGAILIITACSRDALMEPRDMRSGRLPATDSTAAVEAGASIGLKLGETRVLHLSGLLRNRTTEWVSSNPVSVSVNSTGTIRANSPGQAVITGTNGGVSQAFNVSVLAPNAAVTGFELSSADSGPLAPGGTRQFMGTATWSDGVTRAVDVEYVATGGTMTAGGLYTAGGVTGTFMVIANCLCGGFSDTVAVEISTIVPPVRQLQKLTISPKTVELEPGVSRQFTVTANWSTGATDVPPVEWRASGGSISSSGTYVAPNTLGTYKIIVQHKGHSLADTATVIVKNGEQSDGAEHEPTFNSSTDKLVDEEDFDGFESIASTGYTFRHKYPVGRTNYPAVGSIKMVSKEAEEAGILSLVSPDMRGAGNALRLMYGGANGASDIIVGPDAKLHNSGQLDGRLPAVGGPYTHFFLTIWFRTSPGANPAAYDASGVKGVMIFNTSGGRYQRNPTRLNYKYGRWSETRWNYGGGYPENRLSGKQHWKTPDGRPPLWTNYNDGSWHRVTREIYTVGDPSGLVGERCWDDGVLVFDNVGDLLQGLDPSGNKWDVYRYDSPITHWMVFGNYVRSDVAASSPPFWIEFDNWMAWSR